jgi:hypothetical protein
MGCSGLGDLPVDAGATPTPRRAGGAVRIIAASERNERALVAAAVRRREDTIRRIACDADLALLADFFSQPRDEQDRWVKQAVALAYHGGRVRDENTGREAPLAGMDIGLPSRAEGDQ